ncbi:hypothetical protein [Pseudarthrobacter sp. N5]|uniref:hypothetical protein n=1 Tax=Pseudarthrobacter sp. N5 TaxID=3418416 RepID=UPI003CEE73D5
MSNLKPSSSTGLVDSANGRPVRAHADSGQYYVPKAGWPHFWGRALDALVVIAVAGILMAVVNSLTQSLALGSLSYALLSNTGIYATVVIVIWFLVLFVYGMIMGTTGTLGDAAAGMCGVRIADGSTAGPWLGGWRAVCWSFAPLYLIMVLAVAVSGGGGDSFDAKFVAIDLRSGLAGGAPPVADPKLAAGAQDAEQKHRQLPKLYGNGSQHG